MRSTLTLSAAVLAFALAGCNNPNKTAANDGPASTTDPAATTADTPYADASGTPGATDTNGATGNDAAGALTGAASSQNDTSSYAMKAAIGDMFEIESSRLALERSKTPAIRKFAQQMISDHTAASQQLKSALSGQSLAINLPTALDSQHEEMLNDLRKADAKDFDTKYLDLQSDAHRQAIDLHEDYAENGDNAALKTLAANLTPKIKQHLEMAKSLDHRGADDQHS